MTAIDLKPLCRRLGYSFKNVALLKQALSHCSFGNENNERLEFLGDAILGFVIARSLYARFPEESEGQLSRLRSFLVKGEMLAGIAAELQLGQFLFLGPGELKSGGFRRNSILADALEALIAAICLDGGMEVCEKVILNLFASRLNDDRLLDTLKDPKSLLQEFLQAKRFPLPVYTLIRVTGEEHNQVFQIRCSIPGIDQEAQGLGTTRRKAEQEAAALLLRDMKEENPI